MHEIKGRSRCLKVWELSRIIVQSQCMITDLSEWTRDVNSSCHKTKWVSVLCWASTVFAGETWCNNLVQVLPVLSPVCSTGKSWKVNRKLCGALTLCLAVDSTWHRPWKTYECSTYNLLWVCAAEVKCDTHFSLFLLFCTFCVSWGLRYSFQ